MFSNDACNLFKQTLGVNRTSRVRRRAEDKKSRFLSQFGLKNLWIQQEVIRDLCRNNHRCCISQSRLFCVAYPIRCRDYNLKKHTHFTVIKQKKNISTKKKINVISLLHHQENKLQALLVRYFVSLHC